MSRPTDRGISDMTGDEALPRKNGELVFNEPWEGRAFGLAAVLTEGGVYDWVDFRDRLVEVTAANEKHGEQTGYYQRWFRALERLALDRGLVTPAELDARTEALSSDRHAGHWFAAVDYPRALGLTKGGARRDQRRPGLAELADAKPLAPLPGAHPNRGQASRPLRELTAYLPVTVTLRPRVSARHSGL